jgi:hypothetical protein
MARHRRVNFGLTVAGTKVDGNGMLKGTLKVIGIAALFTFVSLAIKKAVGWKEEVRIKNDLSDSQMTIGPIAYGPPVSRRLSDKGDYDILDV